MAVLVLRCRHASFLLLPQRCEVCGAHGIIHLLRFAAGVASFHGSPLMRNGSTFKPGTSLTVAMFNGYDDSTPGANAKAKAEVQARTRQYMQPCQLESAALVDMQYVTHEVRTRMCCV